MGGGIVCTFDVFLAGARIDGKNKCRCGGSESVCDEVAFRAGKFGIFQPKRHLVAHEENNKIAYNAAACTFAGATAIYVSSKLLASER